MTSAELAERSGIGVATIKRLEVGMGIPPAHAKTLDQLGQALIKAGVEFIGTPDDGPGVRLVSKKKK